MLGNGRHIALVEDIGVAPVNGFWRKRRWLNKNKIEKSVFCYIAECLPQDVLAAPAFTSRWLELVRRCWSIQAAHCLKSFNFNIHLPIECLPINLNSIHHFLST